VAACATDARRWIERLGADVASLTDDGSARVRQALSDAAERYLAAGGALAGAVSEQDFRLARRTALEGLYCTRTARTALGLDTGPQLPPLEQDGLGAAPAPAPMSAGVGARLGNGTVTAGVAGLGIGLLAGELLGGLSGSWGGGDDDDFEGSHLSQRAYPATRSRARFHHTESPGVHREHAIGCTTSTFGWRISLVADSPQQQPDNPDGGNRRRPCRCREHRQRVVARASWPS
jgi:hypothetical protein